MPNIKIHINEMSHSMQQDLINVATVAIKKHTVDQEIASYIKQYFDNTYEPTWHCVVGKQYGSNVTHCSDNFIYYYHDELAILLFKTE